VVNQFGKPKNNQNLQLKKTKHHEKLTPQKKGRVHTHPFQKNLLRVEGSKIKHVITNNYTLLQNYENFLVYSKYVFIR